MFQQIPSLKKGDHVAIVATAGQLSFDKIQPAIHQLKKWGLQVYIASSVRAKHGYFAGDDQLRLQDLQQALDTPHIKAVFCARGGYGTTRIIDGIDWKGFKKHPKWLVGFSDITALHGHLHQLGFESLHAPTLTAWNHEEAVKYIYTALFENPKPLIAPPEAGNQHGVVTAPIIGGNLCMLNHLIGTPSMPNVEGKILFIEEVGEAPYAVDRLLIQLQRAGVFKGIVGLTIGDLDVSREQEKQFGISLRQMVLEKVPEHIPLAFSMPIGHTPRNLAVVCGRQTQLKVSEQGAVLDFQASI